jgi:hypothetical protein
MKTTVVDLPFQKSNREVHLLGLGQRVEAIWGLVNPLYKRRPKFVEWVRSYPLPLLTIPLPAFLDSFPCS